MAENSGPGRPHSLFDAASDDVPPGIRDISVRREEARAAPRPSPPEPRGARPPPGAPSQADTEDRPRKLVFSRTEADAAPAPEPLEDLFAPPEPLKPGSAARIAVITGAIVIFVFLSLRFLEWLWS